MTKSQILEKLYKAVINLNTKEEVEAFFGDLMTPQEISNFADRWEVAKQLDSGKTQRKVAADTGVALATVTRVNKFLKNGFNGYRLLIDRLHHHTNSNSAANASG